MVEHIPGTRLTLQKDFLKLNRPEIRLTPSTHEAKTKAVFAEYHEVQEDLKTGKIEDFGVLTLDKARELLAKASEHREAGGKWYHSQVTIISLDLQKSSYVSGKPEENEDPDSAVAKEFQTLAKELLEVNYSQEVGDITIKDAVGGIFCLFAIDRIDSEA